MIMSTSFQSNPSDIVVDAVDLGEDLLTVTAEDIDIVEDAPMVEADIIDKVEKYVRYTKYK